MNKLQSANDFVADVMGLECHHHKVKAVEARDKAVAQVCADAYLAWRERGGGPIQDGAAAILHAIDPPEDIRERLGRVIHKYSGSWLWEALGQAKKEEYCKVAEDVLAEKAKIKEEQDG